MRKTLVAAGAVLVLAARIAVPEEPAARLEALIPILQAEPPAGYARLLAEGEALWGGPVVDPREEGKLPDGEDHEWAVPVAADLGAVPDFVRSRLVGRPVAVAGIEDFLRFDLEGRPHRLSELWSAPDGSPVKVLALHWFAEWCGNSDAEAPYLAALQRAYGPKGLRVVGMAEYSHPEKLRDYIRRHQLPFLVLQGTPNRLDEDIRPITEHYRYRKSLGDERKWGTPLTAFLENGNTRHVTVVLGEMRRIPTEAFLHAALVPDPVLD